MIATHKPQHVKKGFHFSPKQLFKIKMDFLEKTLDRATSRHFASNVERSKGQQISIGIEIKYYTDPQLKI